MGWIFTAYSMFYDYKVNNMQIQFNKISTQYARIALNVYLNVRFIQKLEINITKVYIIILMSSILCIFMTLMFSRSIILFEIFRFSNEMRICYWTAILLCHNKMWEVINDLSEPNESLVIYRMRLNSNNTISSPMLLNYLFTVIHVIYNRLSACKNVFTALTWVSLPCMFSSWCTISWIIKYNSRVYKSTSLISPVTKFLPPIIVRMRL